MRVGILAYGFERTAPPSFVSYTNELVTAMRELDDSIEFVMLLTSKRGAHRIPSGVRSAVLPGSKWLPGLMTIGNVSLAALVHSLRLDIVYDPTGIAPFLLRALYPNVKVVTTIHDLVSYVYPSTHTSLTNLLQKTWLPRNLRHVTTVLTVSEHSRRDLCKYLDVQTDKIRVIPCGVNPRFNPIAQEEERKRLIERYGIKQPYILYIGDVQARKNIVNLLKAFAQLRTRQPGRMLVVAGAPTWKYQAVYETVQQLDLAADALFTGFVADEYVPALYRHAELFVFPSLYEGFGRPPLEAMACGTPVVTSNVSSLPEVVGDAALTVDPYNVDDIAAAMERALSDKTLHAELRRRGLERAAEFTWARAARETLAVYREALGLAEETATASRATG
jgi:glycosyltransferase involved in cell wall biosynthesis